jgi:hypothetical protein
MRRVVEGTCWFAVLSGAWVATLSGLSDRADLLAGPVCAVPCAIVAVAARRAMGAAWRPRPRWAAWPALVPAAIGADTARLFGRALPRLLRDRRAGGVMRLADAPPSEDPARAAARRAMGTLIVSASPGTVVVDWPSDARPPTVHALGSGRPDVSSVVTR